MVKRWILILTVIGCLEHDANAAPATRDDIANAIYAEISEKNISPTFMRRGHNFIIHNRISQLKNINIEDVEIDESVFRDAVRFVLQREIRKTRRFSKKIANPEQLVPLIATMIEVADDPQWKNGIGRLIDGTEREIILESIVYRLRDNNAGETLSTFLTQGFKLGGKLNLAALTPTQWRHFLHILHGQNVNIPDPSEATTAALNANLLQALRMWKAFCWNAETIQIDELILSMQVFDGRLAAKVKAASDNSLFQRSVFRRLMDFEKGAFLVKEYLLAVAELGDPKYTSLIEEELLLEARAARSHDRGLSHQGHVCRTTELHKAYAAYKRQISLGK